MLVLTRRANETITIDDKTKLKVKSISGGRVKIAIDAPRDVRIQREEVKPKPADP